MSRLALLAANPKGGASREEIYLAVASLYRIQGTGLNARERDLMRQILRRLTRDVEMAIRIALAERLTDDTNAPHDLILLLVDDSIEVARPLILHSPLLTDEDALRLIAEASADHKQAVAGRPNIAEPITDALIHSGSESVLETLVRNATAKISSTGYETLVEKSRNVASLQDPLARRRDLPEKLANQMCDWVSDALKNFIAANYEVGSAKLDKAIDQAETIVRSEAPGPRMPLGESAEKLIEKLAASGQLKAGFLMRVLSQGQTDLFDLAFSRLLNLALPEFRRIFYDSGARIVALACRAVGIDRSVFTTVYNLSRQARNQQSSLSRTDLSEVEKVFTSFSRPVALQELQSARPR